VVLQKLTHLSDGPNFSSHGGTIHSPLTVMDDILPPTDCFAACPQQLRRKGGLRQEQRQQHRYGSSQAEIVRDTFQAGARNEVANG
jgi:hypothetical protein